MERYSWLESQARLLYDITHAVNASFSQQAVLDVLLARIVTGLGYKAATLRLLDREQVQLELRASYGLSEAYLDKGIVAVAHSGIDQSVLHGRWMTIDDVTRDPLFQYPEQAAKEGLASLLAVPLAVHEQPIGVLHVYSAETHTFRPAEQAFVAAIANLGAQAIERTRLFGAFRRIAHLLNSSLQVDEVLSTLLVESVRELNVKAGSIRLLGPKRQVLHLAAAYGLSDAYLQKGPVQVAESPIDRRVLQDSQPVVVTGVTGDSGLQYPAEAAREGIRSVVVIPLRVREVSIGVLRLYSAQVRQFSAEETSFAAAIADLGAVAIENAKLHAALQERLEALKADSDGWYRFLAFG